jgi:hypothetical protein
LYKVHTVFAGQVLCGDGCINGVAHGEMIEVHSRLILAEGRVGSRLGDHNAITRIDPDHLEPSTQLPQEAVPLARPSL